MPKKSTGFDFRCAAKNRQRMPPWRSNRTKYEKAVTSISRGVIFQHMAWRHAILAALLVCGLLAIPATAEQPRPVDFARDVQPILKSACYQCHGPAKQKGKL